jgi:hypothetical protein
VEALFWSLVAVPAVLLAVDGVYLYRTGDTISRRLNRWGRADSRVPVVGGVVLAVYGVGLVASAWWHFWGW